MIAIIITFIEYKELLNKIEEGDRRSLNKFYLDYSHDIKMFVINDQQETLLHLACRKGHLDLVRALIEIYNCTLKAIDKFGNSPFHVACANKHLDIVQYFSCFIYTLPCTHLNVDGDTVLHVACQTGCVPLVRVIIHEMFLSHKFVVPLKIDMYQDNVLSHEFTANNLRKLSSRFGITGLQNHVGFTPIHTACYYGHLDILRFFFLEVKSCVNVPDIVKTVPSLLAIACKRKHYNIIDYLHIVSEEGINTYLTPLAKGFSKGCKKMTDYYEECVDQYGNYVHGHDHEKLDLHGKYYNQYHTSRNSPLETSLFYAARHADISLFKHLTRLGNVSHKPLNCSGDTLLHAACASCDFEMVELAYVYTSTQMESCIDRKNDDGNTCLHIACEWGTSLDIIKFLIEKGFSVDAKNHIEQTPFHLAITHGRYSIFELLLSMPIDINAATGDGETPLHLATSANLCSFAERIFAHPNFSSLNHQDEYGDTPIFNACRMGDINMLSMFADHQDCNLLIVNKCNETIFNIACRLKMAEVLRFLFSKITSYPPKLFNHLGQTLLHIACSTNSLVTVETLASHDAIYSLSEDINLVDKINKLTPLQFACTENDTSLLRYLIGIAGCDPDTRNNAGDTALHICCKNNFVDLADILKEHCSQTVRNQLGDTPLHVACKNNHHKLALILLKHRNASIKECFNTDGDSVLHVAAGRSNAVRVVRYIVENNICDQNVQNQANGNIPLHCSCLKNQLDSTLYLLQLNYEEKSWYNQERKSPLFISLENHLSFILSIISTNLVKSWQFQKCIQLKHPFKKFKHEIMETEEYVDIPLPHYLVLSIVASHTGLREFLNSNARTRMLPQSVQGDDFKASCDTLLKQSETFSLFSDKDSLQSSDDDDDSSSDERQRTVHFTLKASSFRQSRYRSCNDDCKKGRKILSGLIKSFPSVLTMVDSQGCTLLHYLALGQCPMIDKIATKILQLNVIDHKTVNFFRNSALHFACLFENEPMIFKLLRKTNGYQLLHEKNALGQTPSDICEESHRSSIIDYLVAWGAEPKVPSIFSSQLSRTKSSSVAIIVLGTSSVGKTTLIHTLKAMLTDERSAEFLSEPTTSIVTYKIRSFKDGYWYTFHDFAGQISSHSPRLESLLSFDAETALSSPFVFLILVKGTDSFEENKKQIDRWFGFICRHIKGTNRDVHLAIVCSHDDFFENEKMRQKRKVELQRYLKLLDTSTLKLNEFPILLNGLKTDTVPLNSLLRYLDGMFLTCSPIKLNQTCEELLSLLEEWFPAKLFQIKDVIKKINRHRKFGLMDRKIIVKCERPDEPVPHVPHELNKLAQLLKQMHVHNHVILLMLSDEKCEWWVINEYMQDTLFCKATSIFSPTKFEDAHNTGVIPSSELFEIFSDLNLKMELLEKYLICMEFCKIIEDEELLNLISDDEMAANRENYFFFPGLVRQEREKITFKKSSSAYCCGLILENQQDFGLHFLHTLLLRLAFKFVPADCKSGSRFERRLSLWKNGIFWHTISGIDVFVEVLNDRKVIAFFQCGSERSLYLLAKLRSGILSEIHKVLCGYSSCDTESFKTEEYYLYPPPTNFDYYDASKMSHSCRIPVSDMVKCFKENPESRSVFVSITETVSLEDILGFDSYIPLRRSTLKRLEKEDISSVQKVFDDMPSTNLEDILESDYSCEEWIRVNGENPALALAMQLNKYSIFKLSDLHIE